MTIKGIKKPITLTFEQQDNRLIGTTSLYTSDFDIQIKCLWRLKITLQGHQRGLTRPKRQLYTGFRIVDWVLGIENFTRNMTPKWGCSEVQNIVKIDDFWTSDHPHFWVNLPFEKFSSKLRCKSRRTFKNCRLGLVRPFLWL